LQTVQKDPDKKEASNHAWRLLSTSEWMTKGEGQCLREDLAAWNPATNREGT